jgi:hypothetical protein
MFEQITLLLSFVYALALTHLLSSVTELILARDRVRVFGPHALWMLVPVLILFNNWIEMRALSQVSHWTLAAELMEFAQAIALYFFCSLISIRVPEKGPVDMRTLHLKQRPAFLAAAAVGLTLVLIGNYLDRRPDGGAWILAELIDLPAYGFIALGAFARATWAQWLAPLGSLAMVSAFLIAFPPTG